MGTAAQLSIRPIDQLELIVADEGSDVVSCPAPRHSSRTARRSIDSETTLISHDDSGRKRDDHFHLRFGELFAKIHYTMSSGTPRFIGSSWDRVNPDAVPQ